MSILKFVHIGVIFYFASRNSHDNQSMNVIKTFLCRSSLIRTKVFRAYIHRDRKALLKNKVFSIVQNFINSVEGENRGWPDWDSNPCSYEFTHGLHSSGMGIINLKNFTRVVSCLPQMDQWDEILKAGWVNFCSSGLDKISRRLLKSIEEHDEAGRVFHQDTWIIDKFATTYYWRDDTRLDQSLKEFFKVGERGCYWLSEFGKSFFILGFKNIKYQREFKSKVEKIFDLASSLEELRSSQRTLDSDTIWCSLVGLNEITIDFLPDDARPLITDFLPLYERLIETRSSSDKCLKQFTSLLCKQAAMDIRIKGLAIIVSELKEIDFNSYRKEYILTYSDFLYILWQENKNDLSDTTVRENFQKILRGLVAVGDSIALELATKIASL